MNTLAYARQVASFVGEILSKHTPFFGLLPPEWEGNLKDAFFYTAEFGALTSGATQTVAIQTNRDSGFLMIGAVVDVNDGASPPVQDTYPAMLVTVKDSSSGRDLMDRAVPLVNLAGSAQLPSVWPWPKWIPPGSTISTTIQSQETATRVVRLTYLGFKVFAK